MYQTTENLDNKTNIYDKLIILLIALQIFGYIGDALQPVRLFVIICIPFVLIYFARNSDVASRYRYERFLFVFWIIYGCITLFWALIPVNSIKEILYLTLNFFSFFTIVYFANNALKPQESIMKGWLLFFILTVPIALYELLLDEHLPMAVQDSGFMMNYDSNVFERRFASVTFGNLNAYNVMLCYMLPFVVGFLFLVMKKTQTILIWLLVLCLCYIIVMNGSRGTVMGLLVGCTVFVVYYLKGRKSILVFTLISIATVFLLIYYFGDIFDVILGRFSEQGIADEGRSELINSSLDVFLRTALFGVGAANFMPTMDTVYHLDLVSPHNLFLEVGIQYGLIIFILFMGLLVRLFIKQKANPKISSKFITIASLAMFPITSIIDSGYILAINIWIFMASLYIVADSKYNIK